MTTASELSATGLRIESFTVSPDTDAAPESQLAKWFEGVSLGFHEPRKEPEDLPKFAEAYAANSRTLWGVYDDDAGPHAWDPSIPVATYATMVNTLNVGGGNLIDAHLVTSVTVRPTHRRRGLLRRLITTDLQGAAERGLSIAALTASEATIYGRFGFGAATLTASIEVDVRERFAVTTPAYGHVEVVEPGAVVDLAPQIFAQFHERSRGSVGRQWPYARRAAGLWGEERPEQDKGVRTAVHYDDDGRPDGYVTYKFAGWETKPYTMRVKDLVAGTDAAYLELWRYLGSLDLVDRVTYDEAAINDPLPWALADRRCRELKGDEDVLWLRILDPVAALEARHYETDGETVIHLKDRLGHAEGAFHLVVTGGKAQVTKVGGNAADGPVMDISVLGSLYLGGVDAGTLASAGLIQAPDRASIEQLDKLFSVARQPYCITHF